MNCDMCGRILEFPYEVEVEGATMQLCKSCSVFGRITKQPKISVTRKKYVIKREEYIDFIVEDYPVRIRNARESKNLKQQDLANKIAVKESLIHKIESGNLEPSIELAKKLEKFLGIKLVEKQKEEHQKVKTNDSTLTIGDLLKAK